MLYMSTEFNQITVLFSPLQLNREI